MAYLSYLYKSVEYRVSINFATLIPSETSVHLSLKRVNQITNEVVLIVHSFDSQDYFNLVNHQPMEAYNLGEIIESYVLTWVINNLADVIVLNQDDSIEKPDGYVTPTMTYHWGV